MTRTAQDPADRRLRRAHGRFAASAEAPEAAGPARLALGLARAVLLIAAVAVRTWRGADPLALRPRVLDDRRPPAS